MIWDKALSRHISLIRHASIRVFKFTNKQRQSWHSSTTEILCCNHHKKYQCSFLLPQKVWHKFELNWFEYSSWKLAFCFLQVNRYYCLTNAPTPLPTYVQKYSSSTWSWMLWWDGRWIDKRYIRFYMSECWSNIILACKIQYILSL